MMKDSTMSTPENETVENGSQDCPAEPTQNMQTELHNKGAILTKAWSDLFSFITKYQAELTVKENSMEIAEREIDRRRKQLEEMKPGVAAGNDDVIRLQEEIYSKERQLNKSQSELKAKEQTLQQVQADLSCSMEMLDEARSGLLDKQTELVRNRNDLERLRSELTIKQEQLQIKDNLLEKVQGQLMKENAELREQLELEKRKFELEYRSHEQTKRSMRGSKNHSKSSNNVIEIPDSPPTLDLSVEEADMGLSSIISTAEAQSQQSSQPMETQHTPHSTGNVLSRNFTISNSSSSMALTPTLEQEQTWPVISPSATFDRSGVSDMPTSPQQSDRFGMANGASASDVFFPLSVSSVDEGNKSFLEKTAGGGAGDAGFTVKLEKRDSYPGQPVPISGPIPTNVMSPGGGLPTMGAMQDDGGGKCCAPLVHHGRDDQVQAPVATSDGIIVPCLHCNETFPASQLEKFSIHMRKHSGRTQERRPHTCETCGKTYTRKDSLKEHQRIHTGEKPYSCKVCRRRFTFRSMLKAQKCANCTGRQRERGMRYGVVHVEQSEGKD